MGFGTQSQQARTNEAETMSATFTPRRLEKMYAAMYAALGPSNWWPAESDFEVVVGAVLTQNTAWGNVEKAIAALRGACCLSPRALRALPEEDLARLIRPAGFFRLKARRLRNLLDWLETACGCDLAALRGRDMAGLRAELLAVNGIGPETADCILCYALGYPTFVVDAYTRRIFARHGLVSENIGYEELRGLFMDRLPPDAAMFNEYHALIVRVGKEWCRKSGGRCETCPLNTFLPVSQGVFQ